MVQLRSRRERGHSWLVWLESCRPVPLSLTTLIKTPTRTFHDRQPGGGAYPAESAAK